MILYALPNLASATASKIEVDAAPEAAPLKFKDKESYRAWCANKNTSHCFVSGVEGTAPGARVSAANPPARIHALVAEFDAEPPEDWADRLRQGALPPSWACRSFSGHARAFWALEKPITFVSPRLHVEFLKIAWAEVKAKKLLPGFEEAESSEPAQYFELGHTWTKLGGVLPTALVDGWLARACGKVDWRKEGPAVAVQALRDEGEKRFPGTWPGGWSEFNFGQRGTRFWAGGDASSVIAVETGCVCFTGDQPFVSWSAIFGADWVRRASDEAMGQAISGIYYDAGTGKYWSNGTTVGWIPVGVEDCRRRLAERGLSSTCPKGSTISEVDRALLALQKTRAIDGSFPAFFRPEEVVTVNQKRFLNTSRVSLMAPHPEPHPEPDGFPWIHEFLWELFGDEQLGFYLGWLAHYYGSCLNGRPARGLSLFIAGPPACGKTFLNNVVHRQIFGAAGEATRFLTGEDQFNASLFACPLWTVDDAVASSDQSTSNRFSQVVKAITANDEFLMRGMYREGVRMPWCGRLVVTMNDDPESIRMLPSTELSLMDKIMLLKADRTYDTFPSDEGVAAELPRFCAYLRDMRRDPDVVIGGRFGVRAYHHPELLREAQESEASQSAVELIQEWAREYFGTEGRGADRETWEGSPTALLKEINLYDDLAPLAARLTPNAVHMGRHLNKLIARGTPGISRMRARNRVYGISRDFATVATVTRQ